LHSLFDFPFFFLLALLLGFHLILVLPVECLEFLFLPVDAAICFFGVAPSLDDLAQWSKSVLGSAHIVHKDLVNVLVGLGTLVD
jgi:hypothetical protein